VRIVRLPPSRRAWIFDLDNTLHDATARIFPAMHAQINAFLKREFRVDDEGANRMRRDFWLRYGTTLNGLMRHHGTDPRRFLAETHVFPELADIVVHENALKHALARLGGMKLVFSNAPRHYVQGVLRAMGLARYFEAVYSIEDARYRGKPARYGFHVLLRLHRRRAREPAHRPPAWNVNGLGEQIEAPCAVRRSARRVDHRVAAPSLPFRLSIESAASPAMPRAKGERRLEILKALAQMLEAPRWERITTAALAERLDVSEAALYRHFASKAQMYEGLIEFIETSVFTLANRITQDEADGLHQAEQLVEMLLAFAEKNPGMVRVMTGDALVGEHERLQLRMNQFFDRFESTLKQSLRAAADGDAAGRAATLLRYTIGCLHQYAKSGFAKKPSESFSAQRRYLLT
jgi:TetR/AcrR family transcriptional regulator